MVMELVWNNPSPNRTVYRPPVWEVIRRNGTSKVIPTHEIQAIAVRKLNHRVKEACNDSQALFSPYFCF
jgi:hypothetical protein